MRILVLIWAALALTGCGVSHPDAVGRAADDWSHALENQDWESACALLAPKTVQELEDSAKKPCVEALPDEATPPAGEALRVQSFGKAAQVSWRGETAFLAELAGEWRVYASSCAFTGHQLPYDCSISGG